MNSNHHCTAVLSALACVAATLWPSNAHAGFPTGPLDFLPYPVPGKVTAVVAPDDGHIYAIGAGAGTDHLIYRSINLGPWEQVAGQGKVIGAGSGSSTAAPYVFVANAAGHAYFGPNATLNLGFSELANDTVSVATIDFGGWGGSYDQWGPYGGTDSIGVPGSWIYITSSNGGLYGRFEPLGTNGGASDGWMSIPLPGGALAKKVVALGAVAFVIDTAGHIFRGSSGTQAPYFFQMPGCAIDIAIGSSSEPVVIGCGAPDLAGNRPVYHYVSAQSYFVQDNAAGIGVAAAKGVILGTGTTTGQVYVITAAYDLLRSY